MEDPMYNVSHGLATCRSEIRNLRLNEATFRKALEDEVLARRDLTGKLENYVQVMQQRLDAAHRGVTDQANTQATTTQKHEMGWSVKEERIKEVENVTGGFQEILNKAVETLGHEQKRLDKEQERLDFEKGRLDKQIAAHSLTDERLTKAENFILALENSIEPSIEAVAQPLRAEIKELQRQLPLADERLNRHKKVLSELHSRIDKEGARNDQRIDELDNAIIATAEPIRAELKDTVAELALFRNEMEQLIAVVRNEIREHADDLRTTAERNFDNHSKRHEEFFKIHEEFARKHEEFAQKHEEFTQKHVEFSTKHEELEMMSRSHQQSLLEHAHSHRQHLEEAHRSLTMMFDEKLDFHKTKLDDTTREFKRSLDDHAGAAQEHRQQLEEAHRSLTVAFDEKLDNHKTKFEETSEEFKRSLDEHSGAAREHHEVLQKTHHEAKEASVKNLEALSASFQEEKAIRELLEQRIKSNRDVLEQRMKQEFGAVAQAHTELEKQVAGALAKRKEESDRNLQLKCDEIGSALRRGLEEESRVRADWIKSLKDTVEHQRQDTEKEKSVRADWVGTLKEAIEKHGTKMGTVEATMSELQTLTGENIGAIAELKTLTGENMGTISELQNQCTKMSTVEATISELQTLTGENMSAVGDKMSAYEIGTSAFAAKISDTSEKMSTLEATVSAQQAGLSNQERILSSMQTETDEKMGTLDAGMKGLLEEAARRREENNSFKGAIEEERELQSQINDFQNKLRRDFDREVQLRKETLSSLGDGLATLSEHTANFKGEMEETLQSGINEFATVLRGDLEREVQLRLQEELSEFKKEMSEMAKRIESLTQDDGRHQHAGSRGLNAPKAMTTSAGQSRDLMPPSQSRDMMPPPAKGAGHPALKDFPDPSTLDPATLFKMLDKDGDGILSPEEFALLAQVRAAHAAKQTPSAPMQTNSGVPPKQTISGVPPKQTNSGVPPMQAFPDPSTMDPATLFKMLDKDGDGILSKEEFALLAKARAAHAAKQMPSAQMQTNSRVPPMQTISGVPPMQINSGVPPVTIRPGGMPTQFMRPPGPMMTPGAPLSASARNQMVHKG